ncbi:MAG: MBG domain-containing protein, partial [Chitinophagaceae bacterium]
AQNANKLYGQANPGFNAMYNGFVNGEGLSTSGIAGRPALTTLANENSGVGIYPITASLGTLSSTNYDFTFEGASLTIGKASMKIKVASATRMYGEANPRFTVEYSGFVNNETLTSGVFVGTPVISTAAVLNSPVGIYPITASVGTLDAVNYDFTFEQGLLTVTKAPLTLTAENKARKYGESNPAFTFQASGFMNSENWDNSGISGQPMLSTEANASSPAGKYAILLSNGSLNGGNYELSFVNGQLEIGKAMITVKAEDKSRIYGSANPQLTTTYTGFVNGENLGSSGITGAPALTTLATASSRAGIYSIAAGEGTLSAGNYEFQYAEGKLTIGKATLTITAENKSRKYGEANPSLTYTLNGFVLGEGVSNSDISGLPVLSTLIS